MKIEKNIPITLPRARGYASVAREMEAGDSVLCQTFKEVISIRATIYRINKKHKPVTRKQPDGTWRVWKVKKDIKN
jgi:hypothetical protein